MLDGTFFGRDAELEAVEAFLDRAAQEPGALVLQGEPGIGKTSLWREARGRAVVRGFRVLDCRPAEAESALSFSGLTDLLEDVPAAGFGSLPEPQRRALSAALLRVSVVEGPDPRSVAAGFRSLLAGLADASPVLVAVDDAQWLDASSASVLAFALRRLEGLRVGFLGAWRPGWQGALDGVLASPYCRLLPLEPFSLAAIHNLLKQRLGRTFPRRLLLALHEACGGNPFYALEIARELAAHDLRAGDPLPVPADLGSLVRRRVARLPAAARNVLLATAAAAQPTRALVAAAVGAGASAGLEEAERAGFLEVVGERLRFSHPLYGAAVMAAAPAERRRRLHGRLAELIEVEEERARQLALATDAPAEEAAAVVERAGEHVRTRGAAAAAATLFLEAVRLTPASDQVGRQRRTLAAAEALFDTADTAAARALLEPLAAEPSSGAVRVRALLLLALVHFYEDGPSRARHACLSALEAADEPRLAAEINLRLAFVAADDLDLARRSAERAVELLDGDADAPADLVAAALLEEAYCRFLTGGGLARAQVELAAQMLSPHGGSWVAQRAHSILNMWWKYTDDLERAHQQLEETVRRRREEGDDYEAALTLTHLAEVECWLGDWSSAGAHAEEAALEIEQAGNPLWRSVALHAQALVAALTGAAAEARAAAEEGLVLAERGGDPWIATLHLSVLGFLQLSLDEPAAADAYLTRAEAAVSAIGLREPARFRFHGDQLEAAIALGELERADDLLQRLRRRAEVAPRPWPAAVAARGEALLAAARGDLDSALEAAAAALAVHERLPMPFERARTLLTLGMIHRRRGERRQASDSLGQALAIFAELGASLWSDRTRRELRQLGGRPTTRGELTATEERVAELAASGLTNREVAAAMFVSAKTVEANLSRIYRKLGIHSRAQLGARIAAGGKAAGREVI